jgi:hypothetical protein
MKVRNKVSMVRRIGAGTLVSVLLVGAVAHAATLYRCRMDGVVRTSCCCPPDDAADQAQSVKDASCCTVEHVKPVQAPTTTSPRKDEALSLAVTLSSPLVAIAPTPRIILLAPTEARSRVGPPILEIKNSRLI